MANLFDRFETYEDYHKALEEEIDAELSLPVVAHSDFERLVIWLLYAILRIVFEIGLMIRKQDKKAIDISGHI